MNILVIGSGGREHTLAWKISQSPELTNLYIAPGNGGTREIGENVDIAPTDFASIKQFSLDHAIDLVVVGPEQPLVEGIVDFFRNDQAIAHIPVLGPTQKGAQLEGSKDFANRFMKKYHIPTADFQTFTIETLDAGLEYLEKLNPPYVLKSDGLAAGKGVIITEDLTNAKEELKNLLEGQFGEASKKVVIEEFLDGKELSVFVLTDGEDYKILPNAKDYKRIGENDTGKNTGGMGAASPVPYADETFLERVEKQIIKPTIEGLKQESIHYRGFLYLGLIMVHGQPYVIEYNVRMGDPETQVVIPRIESDILPVLYAAAKGNLKEQELHIDPHVAAAVILASQGYPDSYEKGKPITIDPVDGFEIFHAGTTYQGEELVTSGGRVMAVMSKGEDFREVFRSIYKNIEAIKFQGRYFRRDIGVDL